MRPNRPAITDIYGNITVRKSDCPIQNGQCNTFTESCEYFEGSNECGTKARCRKALEMEERQQ